MKLARVGFEYRFAEAKFGYLSHSFEGARSTDRDELISLAKASVGELEGILDGTYPKFKKEPDGKVSAASVSQGYKYRSPLWRTNASAQLMYVFELDRDGRPFDAKIELLAWDDDQKRLLELHDSVVDVSSVIAPEAQVQIDRIENLRSEPFVVERYLSIENR